MTGIQTENPGDTTDNKKSDSLPDQQHKQKLLKTSLTVATLTQLTPSGQLPQNLLECNATTWIDLVPKLSLSGVSKALCMHCTVEESTENGLWLVLDQEHDTLYNTQNHQRIAQALEKYFSYSHALHIRPGKVEQETPALYDERKKQESLNIACCSIYDDQNVQQMISVLDARVDDSSITMKEK